MSGPGWFVGIDGGGTRTDLALVDVEGVFVSRLRGATSNRAVVGPDAAIEVLRSLIDEALDQAGATRPIAAGWIGLAGADRHEDQALFRAALADRIDSIRITNDAELVLSGNPESIGIALIGGTGSIAFARNEAGVSGRSGGWGHIFGDEGSAYGLAVNGLRTVAAATDGRGPETSLTESLMDYWQAGTPQQLISKVYHAAIRKSDIAASAPVIVNAAREGDSISLQLLESAAFHLASLIISLLHRIPFSSPPSVAVTGGLLLHVPELRELLRQELRDQPCQDELTMVEDVAVSAAQAIRLQTMKGGV
jgi:N-acetylglucosamine kinase-like BadF-type ATPase